VAISIFTERANTHPHSRDRMIHRQGLHRKRPKLETWRIFPQVIVEDSTVFSLFTTSTNSVYVLRPTNRQMNRQPFMASLRVILAPNPQPRQINTVIRVKM